MKSMDDLPDIPAENRFEFSADFAEIIWPDMPDGYWEIRPEYRDTVPLIPDGGYNLRFAKQHEQSNDIYSLHPDFVQIVADALHEAEMGWRWGVLLRAGSVWVGAHWSPKNRRLCVNLIPFVTFWVTPPGGRAP